MTLTLHTSHTLFPSGPSPLYTGQHVAVSRPSSMAADEEREEGEERGRRGGEGEEGRRTHQSWN